MCWRFIFQCCVVFSCVYVPSRIYPFRKSGPFGLFLVWGYYKCSCYEYSCAIFCTLRALISPRCIPQSGRPGSWERVYLVLGGIADPFFQSGSRCSHAHLCVKLANPRRSFKNKLPILAGMWWTHCGLNLYFSDD